MVKPLERSGPGQPPILTSLTFDYLLNNLYTLTYIRNTSMKTVLVLLPSEININDAVELAKKFCKTKSYSFNWLEKTINDLRSEGVA